jgi:DNA-binding transcriptional ArsR family regulator
MSTPTPDPRWFAALGDPTRLRLVERLHAAPALSITLLTAGTELTRQAVTKHLEVLREAGLVRDVKQGRERVWMLDGAPLQGMWTWLQRYRGHWEPRLDRLASFVEEPEK